MIVVDTSFVVKLLKKEISAEILEDEELLAPLLFDFEIVNVIWKIVNFANYSQKEAEYLFQAVDKLGIKRCVVNIIELFQLACDTKLTAYDSAYLLLAQTKHCSLATCDKELAKIAKKYHINVIA